MVMEEPQQGLHYKRRSYDLTDISMSVCFVCGSFCVGAYYSIVFPFFPQEAMSKGMSATIVGLIFSSYEIAITILAPLFGNYLKHIGAKFAYISGLGTSAIACILFGILDYSPDGSAYITMCFITRIFEGVGIAAFLVSSVAFMASRFPEKAGTIASSSTACISAGMMVGPAIGGILYGLGGYILPFIVFGLVALMATVISMCILDEENVGRKESPSILLLLKIPLVRVMSVSLLISCSTTGLRQVGVSVWLTNTFQATPTFIGFVFLVHSLAYSLMVIIWGVLADKYPGRSLLIMIIAGHVVAGISLIFIGPAPFIHLPNNMIWLFMLCIVLNAGGTATKTIFFRVVSNAAKKNGMKEDIDLYGNIVGLNNFFYSAGNTIGPFITGYVMDVSTFQWGGFIFGCALLFCAALILGYIITECMCSAQYDKDDTDDTMYLLQER